MAHGYRRASASFPVRMVLVVALVAVCGARTPTQLPAPLPYGVVDLGLPAGAASAGHDIADLGQAIVGQAQTGSGAFHAFHVGMNGARDLGTLGGTDSTAFAVLGNIVVGQARN